MEDETIQIDMRPEEAVSMALVQDLIENSPETVIAMLRAHEVQPSTDPEENVLKLAKLSAERGRFFNEDFAKGAASAGYHGTEMVPDVLSKFCARHKDVKNFQAGYFKIADIFKKKDPNKPGLIDKIKNLFGKKDGGTVAPDDMAVSDAGNETKKELKASEGEDKGKLILGLKPWIFYTGLGFVLVLIIVIIILIIRANRKEKEA